MIALHTVFVVTLVSQATSTVVLFLLAWGDRRFRGLVQLAWACAIHTAAIGIQPLWRNKGLWLPEGIALSMLPLMLFLFYSGSRAFFQREARRPAMEKVLLGTVMVVLFAMAPAHQLWPLQTVIASLTGCAILAANIRVLWNAGTGPVQLRARITACLLMVVLATFLARLVVDPAKAADVVIVLRELTMVNITLLAFSFLALYLAESSRLLHKETRLDALTGLPNRRAMEEIAAGHLKVSGRKNTPIALLMMDLDAFKALNDTWGHAVGDRALRAVGEVLLAATMDTRYTVARLGGEEFAMLLPGQSLARAEVLAEELRLATAGIVLHEGTGRITVTVSIGVAVWQSDETSWANMLHRADIALYRAKRDGRNRVVLCAEAAEEGREVAAAF